MEDIWWYLEDNSIMVWTTNTKLKTKTKECALYRDLKGKLFAIQYCVSIGSSEYKELFKQLKLTEKNRLLDVRKPRGGLAVVI